MSYFYNANPRLKRAGVQYPYTQDQMDEMEKCAADEIYFALNYMKIYHVDSENLISFDMWDFQKDMIRKFKANRFVISKMARQSGKSTTVIAYLLHSMIFRKNTRVAILANKGKTAAMLLGRLQLAYENLPVWMQQGVVEWNKGNITLENGSQAVADATSAGSIRGSTYNIIFIDEMAHIPAGQVEAFFTSTYPVISSGKTTQVLIVSTPLGMNMFYKMWKDAVEGRSLFVPIDVTWRAVPGRDDKWKEETIRNTSQAQFDQEHECDFLGSSNTLIAASKLKTLAFSNPLRSIFYGPPNGRTGSFDVYNEPIVQQKDRNGKITQEAHTYAITVDVSEGQGKDFSAFSVIDITDIPYKQVAKFRRNDIPPLLYPTEIYNVARYYNDAFVLVEVSTIGLQVADILHYELEYENLVKIQLKGRQGQQVSAGHVKKIQLGLKQSKTTKKIGCANLKTLVESDRLIVNDSDTIMELMMFVADKDSYAAEEGYHDDLAMSLVLFGWFSAQRHIKEALKNDIRKNLQAEQYDMVEEDVLPFGILDDGMGDREELSYDEIKEGWVADRKQHYPFDSYTDEVDYEWIGKLSQ